MAAKTNVRRPSRTCLGTPGNEMDNFIRKERSWIHSEAPITNFQEFHRQNAKIKGGKCQKTKQGPTAADNLLWPRGKGWEHETCTNPVPSALPEGWHLLVTVQKLTPDEPTRPRQRARGLVPNGREPHAAGELRPGKGSGTTDPPP